MMFGRNARHHSFCPELLDVCKRGGKVNGRIKFSQGRIIRVWWISFTHVLIANCNWNQVCKSVFKSGQFCFALTLSSRLFEEYFTAAIRKQVNSNLPSPYSKTLIVFYYSLETNVLKLLSKIILLHCIIYNYLCQQLFKRKKPGNSKLLIYLLNDVSMD